MKKSLIAILMTAVMLLPLIAPLMTVEAATDPSDWYMTVPGVLDTDYYKLYPYETNASLTIGFSKFGELINSATNVGLEYAAVDPFAPPAGSGLTAQVPKRDWLQGWFINITYHHRTLGDRNVWAMAVHSDAIDYGNDWIRVDFPNDHSTSMGFTNNKFNEDPRCVGYLIYGTGTYGVTAVNGGRKTNGTCVTAPIKVLYNGPREFIAECRTTIYDHPIYGSNSTASDIGLVQVVITVLFDKVKKEVTLLKDVKSLLPLKEGEEMKIEFSNRGEVDLGTDAASYGSYGHFYTEGTAEWDTEVYGGEIDEEDEGLYTCYGYNWEIIQTEDPLDTDYPGFSAAGPFPQSSDAGTFDVAQAINERAGYVWYGAFWPSLSDWSIDGWDQWWHSLHVGDPHYIDYRNPDDEPNFVPFYIGEWDFVLRNTADALNRTQFRGVTQYGVVYQHDAEDEAMFDGKGDNVIDREVWYYLDETFNPWSLDDAVDKYTRRWVEWKVSGTSYTTKRAPVLVVDADEWDQYAMFADRVYRVDTGKLLNRYQGDYTLTYNSATGTATFSGLPTAKCKILYSTEPYWERSGTVNSPSAFHTYSNVAPGTEVNFTYTNSQTLSKDPLGVIHSYEFTVWMGVKVQPTVGADFSATTDDPDLDDVKRDFLVNPEYPMTTTYYFWDNETFATSNLVMTSISLEPTNLLWTINSAGANESVYIETLDIRLNLKATVSYNITESELNVTFAPYMGYYYEEDLMGCYEWAEVGRDAASVDSVGLALVSEAFDSIKGIPTGIAGADMDNPVVANQMPFVMNKFGAGTSKADYKDALGRAALNDDWCTYWPVASSNMIGVGGPLANLLAYYANDFTTAMYGLSPYAGTGPYLDMIVPVTCWDKAWPTTDGLYHLYSSSSSTGYAVISTYLDINGTELFMVWGGWGRDTYYASQWLHGDVARNIPPGIVQLQDAPCGATSIILKIDYTDPKHPTFSIVEVLGTISETLWVHNSEYKGGIHDP